MSGHIRGEVCLDAEHLGELVQKLVVFTKSRGILPMSLTDIGTGQYGEEVGAIGGIPVYELTHLGLYLDFYVLSCLATFIYDAAMPYVLRLQIGKIDKGKPTGTEAKDKDVASKRKFPVHP